jgi:glutathione S-transferase
VSKVIGPFHAILRAEGEEAEKAAGTFVDAIVKELEPLLKDAGPFFGGSSRLTLAEVNLPLSSTTYSFY